jgi:hypothetical protein
VLIGRLVSHGELTWAKLSSIPIAVSTAFHLTAWIFKERHLPERTFFDS